MKLKLSLAQAHRAPQRSGQFVLLKPSAVKAMAPAKRRSMGDIKRHALNVSDLAMSDEVVDIRKERGFAPLDLQYQVVAWPKL